MKIASHRIVAGALALTMSVAGTGFPLPNSAIRKPEEASKNATKTEFRKTDTRLTGTLLSMGAATINGKKALPGTTIFSESRIAVANTAGNQAVIKLGQLGRLDLGPGTELVLRLADDLISGELLAGEAVIKSNAGVKVALHTPTGLALADGRKATATVASAMSDSEKLVAKRNKDLANAGAGMTVGASNTQSGGSNPFSFLTNPFVIGGIVAAAIAIPIAITQDKTGDMSFREVLSSGR